MYEPFFTSFINNLNFQNGIALDIGANLGYYSNLMSSKFELIYSFEPDYNNIKKLKKNLISDNVIIIEKAIKSETGKTFLYKNINNNMHTTNINMAKTYDHINFDFDEIECISLDDFCLDKKIKFIKCDVEGEEEYLFFGGEKTLKNNKMDILLELHDTINKKELLKYFNALNYYDGSPLEKHHRFIHLTNK